MKREDISSRSHDIQVSLGRKSIPDFESVPQIGMMVNLALHIRGLSSVEYETFRKWADYYFHIPNTTFRQILLNLAEIQFVRLDTEGATIKRVLPNVPFFENVYDKVGEFASVKLPLNEAEQLALTMLEKLSGAPAEKSSMFALGAEKRIITRNLQLGEQGGYILEKRARGKDILFTPVFFAENAGIFADLTAKAGSKKIKRILNLVKRAPGWPLSVIEAKMELAGEPITADELSLLKSLAQDGAVKPPSIATPHAGQQYFMFTPAPGVSKLNPANRQIYERAMSLVASVRQGQLLSSKYAIRSPVAVLNALRRDGFLSSNSEAYNQYHQLAQMLVGQLVPTTGDRYQFKLVQTEENKQALDLAINILETGEVSNMGVNDEARLALQKGQEYVESLVASAKLRESESITMDEETKADIDNLFIKGAS